MQKIYERIDWKNYPSQDTPLNEDNLNKMDFAINEIDKRVVELYGYEEVAKNYANKAATGATNSEYQAQISKSYATGDSGIRSGEQTSNAQYFMEQTQKIKDSIPGEYIETSQNAIISTAQGTSLSLETARGGVRVNKVVGKTYKSKNLISVNNFTNKSRDTKNYFQAQIQGLKDGKFVATLASYIYNEPQSISFSFVVDSRFDAIRLKHNGSNADIIIFTLPISIFGKYTLSANVVGVNTTVVDGLVLTNIMLNEGSEALPYEPYGLFSVGDMGAITVQEHGKNLISFPFSNTTQTSNGVTYTVNDDQSLTINGTSGTSDSQIWLQSPVKANCIKAKKGEKYMALIFGNDISGNVRVQCASATSLLQTSGFTYYSSASINSPTLGLATIQEDCYLGIRVSVSKGGKNVDNARITAMLVKVNDDGTYPTEYEPYRAKDVIIPLSEPLYEQNVLDVENQQIVKKYAKIDKDFSFGSITRRTNTIRFVINTPNKVMCESADVGIRIMSNIPTNIPDYYWSKDEIGVCELLNKSMNAIVVSIPISVSDSEIVDYINKNVVVLYELATPTTEPLTPEQVKALHSLVSYKDETFIDTTDKYAKATFEVEYGSGENSALTLQNHNMIIENRIMIQEEIVNLTALMLENINN